jgi:hypothetical protein
MKCLGKDRYNQGCRNNKLNITNFCKFHQYMSDYSGEMIEKMELCKGCKKMYYFGNTDIKTCENCRARDKSKYKKEIVFCKKEGCKFKKSNENAYCGKHQIQIFIDETINSGKKLCVNYIRGCKHQLELEYIFSKCQECLEKDRIKDHTNRTMTIERNNSIISSNKDVKICTTCCKEYNISEFIGNNPNSQTKTCKICRLQNKEQDKHRDKERRNLLAKKNINHCFSSYVKEANRRSIEFHLSKEDFLDIIKTNCYYCGEINEEKKFNGIDRMDSTKNYILENCVSCCSLCNYLKNKVPLDIFIKRVRHILSYITENKILYPECFPEFISGNYKQYKKSANIRNLDFLLSESMFINITSVDCYLCGKQNSLIHRNGIDRFDNSVGYLGLNCKSCCNTCNMMKNRFSYQDILDKFKKIDSYYN